MQSLGHNRPPLLSRAMLSLALLLIVLEVPVARATLEPAGPLMIEFDAEAIRASGIDPSLGTLFRHAPRFLPGETAVTLTVNGSGRGKVLARFDTDGKLCADVSFQKQAGLVSPPGFDQEKTCFDLKTAWPQTELTLDPGLGHVDLVLPSQAVTSQSANNSTWHHGGAAGLFNYEAQYMTSSGATGGVQFMHLGTEAGLNFDDWIVRSRQTFSRFDGEDRLQHQSAYGQRTFSRAKAVLQAGQISLSNSLFGTGQVLGFQLVPEAALQNNLSGPALVEGITDSQSVLEIRQSGVLVHTTTIPSGPFRVQDFQLLNTRSDLQVTLTGSDGEKRSFTVPASSFLLSGNRVAPGLSFGIGQMDQQRGESSWVATAATGWVLNPRTTLNTGLLGSSLYRAGAVGLDTQLFDATLLSFQGTASQDVLHGSRGASLTASLGHRLSERLSANINVSQQTAGYRDLSDAIQDSDFDTPAQRSLKQLGGGLSWATRSWGSLSLAVARSTDFNGDATHYVRGGWSKQFRQVSVGASLEHDPGSSTTNADSRFYLTLNIPLGRGSTSSYLNTSRNSGRFGVRYQERSSREGGWSLANEQDFHNQRHSTRASMDSITRTSQLSASASQDSDNNRTWTARASGSAVAHGDGLTFSPHRVSDTFGIARIGGERGVKLDTPSGPAWTDSRGYAVLPTLGSYKRSSVQVDTRSLAKNIDIANAFQETEAARGSVSTVDFAVVRTRRVLLNVKDNHGKPLPHGAALFDRGDNFITVVGENGRVFLPDANHDDEITVQSSGQTLCTFRLALPTKADTNALYETADAQCERSV